MLDPRRRPELLTPTEMAEVDRMTIAAEARATVEGLTDSR